MLQKARVLLRSFTLCGVLSVITAFTHFITRSVAYRICKGKRMIFAKFSHETAKGTIKPPVSHKRANVFPVANDLRGTSKMISKSGHDVALRLGHRSHSGRSSLCLCTGSCIPLCRHCVSSFCCWLRQCWRRCVGCCVVKKTRSHVYDGSEKKIYVIVHILRRK